VAGDACRGLRARREGSTADLGMSDIELDKRIFYDAPARTLDRVAVVYWIYSRRVRRRRLRGAQSAPTLATRAERGASRLRLVLLRSECGITRPLITRNDYYVTITIH
jgi:hypothetical protein